MRATYFFTAAFAAAAIASPVERAAEADSAEDSSLPAIAGGPILPFPHPILRHPVDTDAVDEDEDQDVERREAEAEPASAKKAVVASGYESTTTVTTTSTIKSTITVTTTGKCTTTSHTFTTTKKPSSTTKKTSSSTKKSSTKTAAATPSASAASYEQIILDHHNIHRRNHSAADLVWSDALAASAKVWATQCYWAHNTSINGGGYGQNIAAGVPIANVAEVVSDLWYDNEVNHFNGLYGEASPDMTNFDSWGHFTQVVWKQTSKVGCHTSPCSQGMKNLNGHYTSFTVCNYGQPGNFLGEFNTGVSKPLGHSSVYANTKFNLDSYKSY